MRDFSLKEKKFLRKLALRKEELSKTARGTLSTFELVSNGLDEAERRIFNSISSINPNDYGSNEKLINKKEIEPNVVAVTDQAYIDLEDNKRKILAPRYLPTHVHKQFTNMNKAMQTDINKTLIINYGYRAFGYQLLLLCWLLVNAYDFDLEKTLKRVILPRYSQHCSPTNTALDLMCFEDKTTEEDIWAFSRSDEYSWLKSRASAFGFNESYPRHYSGSVMWEPWHWQFIGVG